MSHRLSVDEIVTAIGALNEQERLDLVGQLVRMDDLMEDFEDTLLVMNQADDEPARPFEEFLADMRAEGRDA